MSRRIHDAARVHAAGAHFCGYIARLCLRFDPMLNYITGGIRHVSAISTTHFSPTIRSVESYIHLLNGDAVVEQRKQAVSIRLGDSDIRNIKRIAKRLGVRDSDIIRFAIKSTLGRIAPLCDQGIRG